MSQETSSKYNKLKKRVKVAFGKSVNFSRDRAETLDFKEKGFQGNDRRGQSRRVKTDSVVSTVDDEFLKNREDSMRSSGVKSKNDNVPSHRVRSRRVEGSYVDKLQKRENRGRDFESSYKDRRGEEVRGNERDGFGERGFKAVNSDRKRKRIYADNDVNGDRRFRNNGKGLSRARKHEGGDELVEDKRMTRRGSRDSKKPSWVSLSKRRDFSEKESPDERGDRNMRATGKNTGKVKMEERGDNRNGMLKKIGEVKYDTNKQLPQKQENSADYHEFGKKKFQIRKSSTDDTVAMFDRPRRKKRVIRIEYPNDTANKRFDDSTPTSDNATEHKEDPDTDKDDEMSKNAQFRAIQPSPTILSFVKENLLGRRREIEFRKAGYNIELSSPLDNVPFSTSSERERIEESVFRNKLAFFAAAKVSSSFLSPDLPEIAFAGRSNVGKSSLLNSLTRQWGVVRTSDKPGLTQTINFFNLGSKLCLVDLPGYGFAYAKDEVKESWEELVKEYVSTRTGLKRVCLLIDTKWGMKARDHELVDLMERSKTKYQIVLTKTDLSFPIDVARRAMQIEESLKTKKSVVQPLMMVSSKTGAGIRSLRTVLSNISRFARL